MPATLMRMASGLALAALLVASCALTDGPVTIWTRSQPDQICLQAALGGVLVANAESGLAFRGVDGGANLRIRWPFGWSARRENGVILLIDPKGRTTAREGDQIDGGGGYASDPDGSNVVANVMCAFNVTPAAGSWPK